MNSYINIAAVINEFKKIAKRKKINRIQKEIDAKDTKPLKTQDEHKNQEYVQKYFNVKNYPSKDNISISINAVGISELEDYIHPLPNFGVKQITTPQKVQEEFKKKLGLDYYLDKYNGPFHSLQF